MRLARNLLAGMVSSLWAVLLGLAVVPFYLKYLGIEAYGLIGVFVFTQSLLQLLDFGLAPAINREVARGIASGCLDEARGLLRTFAAIYWTMAAAIVLIVVAAAPLIAKSWLQPDNLSEQSVTQALMLIGLVVGCRWPSGLYQSAMMGAQRLTVTSSISIIHVTVANLGAVAVLAFVSPTIQAFFTWHAAVGALYALVARMAAWKVVGRGHGSGFDTGALKRIWRFSAGMSGVAVSGLILMQLDKVLLSKMLGLDDFGRYMLAASVASGLYVLLAPVFNAIFPRMSALVAANDEDGLVSLYRTGTRLLTATLFPLAAWLGFFSEDLVHLWTGNAGLASSVAPIVSLLLLGTAMNGVMLFPYALQLAYGATRLPLTINAILMAILVPVIIVLALHYGAVGGAAAWGLLNCLYLVLGTCLTHRSLLKGIGIAWLVSDVLMPFTMSVAVVGTGAVLLYDSSYPHYMKLLFGGCLAFVAFASIVATSPALRLRVYDALWGIGTGMVSRGS